MKRIKSILSLSLLVLLVAAGTTPVFAAGPPERTTIYDIASGSPDFTILTFALEATGLDAALDGRRQFTVFAPTDAAFVAAAGDLGLTPEQLVEFLVANPDYLKDVLLYHVAPGRRDSTDVIASERIRTLQRGFLLQDGGTLTDNLGRSVDIVAVDIMADNGIIHVLNNVVLPYPPPL
jgi:uncharacterized surface protein with fasciclin (FAS1) repeats